jgi:hypothetical protein
VTRSRTGAVGAAEGSIISAVIVAQDPRYQPNAPRLVWGPASMPRIRSTVPAQATAAAPRSRTAVRAVAGDRSGEPWSASWLRDVSMLRSERRRPCTRRGATPGTRRPAPRRPVEQLVVIGHHEVPVGRLARVGVVDDAVCEREGAQALRLRRSRASPCQARTAAKASGRSDSYDVDDNLRIGADYHPPELSTYFSFCNDGGSFAAATERCFGMGKCRRIEGGTMCPSFMATREGRHTTRGRPHLLEMVRGDMIGKNGLG